MTPMTRPVLVAGLKPVTHGLPLVPSAKPSQLNLSWLALRRVVQFLQVMGSPELCG